MPVFNWEHLGDIMLFVQEELGLRIVAIPPMSGEPYVWKLEDVSTGQKHAATYHSYEEAVKAASETYTQDWQESFQQLKGSEP